MNWTVNFDNLPYFEIFFFIYEIKYGSNSYWTYLIWYLHLFTLCNPTPQQFRQYYLSYIDGHGIQVLRNFIHSIYLCVKNYTCSQNDSKIFHHIISITVEPLLWRVITKTIIKMVQTASLHGTQCVRVGVWQCSPTV